MDQDNQLPLSSMNFIRADTVVDSQVQIEILAALIEY